MFMQVRGGLGGIYVVMGTPFDPLFFSILTRADRWTAPCVKDGPRLATMIGTYLCTAVGVIEGGGRGVSPYVGR